MEELEWLGKLAIDKYLNDSIEYLTALSIGGKRESNIIKILEIFAMRFLGDKENVEVSQKILREIINAGSYCDDEVALNYYAGLLGSSLSEEGKDDRGIYFCNIINRLSSYQLRIHYLVAINLLDTHKNNEKIIEDEIIEEIKDFRVTIHSCNYHFSKQYFMDAMLFNSSEKLNFENIFNQSLEGLEQENLLSMNLATAKDGVEYYNYKLTNLGKNLFLWSTGNKDVSLNNFFEINNNYLRNSLYPTFKYEWENNDYKEKLLLHLFQKYHWLVFDLGGSNINGNHINKDLTLNKFELPLENKIRYENVFKEYHLKRNKVLEYFYKKGP